MGLKPKAVVFLNAEWRGKGIKGFFDVNMSHMDMSDWFRNLADSEGDVGLDILRAKTVCGTLYRILY